MKKIYTINELKDLENTMSSIDFFNLPSKISKANYKKHFEQKYNEFFIKDLSINQMRRYYNDEVYRFYIDNIEEIKIDNDIFLNYIKTLDVNIKRSITSLTIKSTYNIVLETFLNRLNKEFKFKDNIEYYMCGIIKGSTFKNKDNIIKNILEYLGDDAKKEYISGVKISYIVRKHYFKENLYYYCSSCSSPIEAGVKKKECKSCYLKYKRQRANTKRETFVLNNIPEHINFVKGNFNTEDFYNEEYKIFCKKCNKESIFVFKSKERILKCPICDEKYTVVHKINDEFNNIFKMNDRKFISPFEIDMISYENKLCIEYNGVMFHSYGKSEHAKFNKLNIDEYYHLRKTENVQNNGFKLLHIFENEWLNKREVWVSIINSNLGNNTFIDNYDIKETSNVKEFIDENSLTYYDINKNDIILGAYDSEELIGLMIFRKIENTYVIELCCSKNNIDLDFNKILSFFENLYKCDELIYYINRRYDNCILKGFDFIENTKPRKYYFNYDDKLNLIETVESNDVLINNNYRIIFDCGYSVFKKHLI